jgi:hypothetical protein
MSLHRRIAALPQMRMDPGAKRIGKGRIQAIWRHHDGFAAPREFGTKRASRC